MKEKIIKFLKFLGSYKMLVILWLAVGVTVLIAGEISRINYTCVWLLLVLEYLSKALNE